MLYLFDLNKECDALQSWNGQVGTPKKGITRTMLEEYYARKNAHEAADKHFYKGGVSYRAFVDAKLAEGYTFVEFQPRGRTVLTNKEGKQVVFRNHIINTYLKAITTKPSYSHVLE